MRTVRSLASLDPSDATFEESLLLEGRVLGENCPATPEIRVKYSTHSLALVALQMYARVLTQ